MAQISTSSVSQDEISKILGGHVDSIIIPDEPTEADKPKEDIVEESNAPVLDNNFKWSDLDKEKPAEGDEPNPEPEPVVEQKADEVKPSTEDKEKKPGRKPADILTFVSDLVETGDLLPFDEEEVKTIEDARQLLQLNLKHAKETSLEEAKEEIIASYSPQIQAILHYAENGGQDIIPLLSAIAEVEKTAELDVETEDGQVAIITEYLRTQGWEDDLIKEEIETAKDMDQLSRKAKMFQPKLTQMHAQRVEHKVKEQENTRRQVEETRKTYLNIIQDTLKKDALGDLKLSRQEKGKLWNAVAEINQKSFNGTETNAFYKKLEDLQVGKSADYDHFLELVYFAVDREGYKQRLSEELKTKLSADTVKKLKVQSTKANAGGNVYDEAPVVKKPAITRFKNPFG